MFCNSCRHLADADLQAIVESGCGDDPLTELRFRCLQCGTDRTDFVVTSYRRPNVSQLGISADLIGTARWPPRLGCC